MIHSNEDTQSERKVMARWIVYGLFAEVFVVVTCCFPAVFFLWGGEILAHAMLPPVYPGAQGSCNPGAASAIMWTDCIYSTDEEIDRVLTFYEAEMPGFSLVEVAGQDGRCYQNALSDKSIWGELAANVTDGQMYPGASVMICDHGEAGGSTWIKLSASWPAQ